MTPAPRADRAAREPAGSLGGSAARRVAAIDCGTNSLRLLIADVSVARGEMVDVERRMEIVRLGQGVDATGAIAPVAMARTLGVLREYAQSISAAGASAVRMVATSATRDARNGAEFIRGAVHVLGVAPEVITGEEEARLSFTGATAELASAELATAGLNPSTPAGPRPPYLIVDIGGGSTEFVVGPDEAAGRPDLSAVSLNIGCVRLTERYLATDPPAAAEIAAASAAIDAAIATAAAAVPVSAAQTLVGLAGSVTTVAAIALGLPAYDAVRTHHARISAGRVHEVTERLLRETRAQRAAIGPMHPGRVDVIGAGALILDRVLAQTGFGELVVSEHDILDGIAWSIAVDDR